jgi:hypothetical protein
MNTGGRRDPPLQRETVIGFIKINIKTEGAKPSVLS